MKGVRLKQEDRVSAMEFHAEVRAWAERIGVVPKRVQIQRLTRKWASCSTAGRLTFSRDLLAEPSEFRREVIVHELLHLVIPNHGKLFRSLMRAHAGREVNSRAISCATMVA